MWGSYSIYAVKLAVERGYKIQNDGTIIGRRKHLLKLFSNKTDPRLQFSVRDPKTNYVYHIYVHKFGAYCWFGEIIFSSKIEVRHLDGNNTNNTRSNIAIGTHFENLMDIPPEQRVAHARIAALAQRKLTSQQVKALRYDRRCGFTYKELMNKYNIAKSTVSYIVNVKTYSNEF